jgi:hypothetical protein
MASATDFVALLLERIGPAPTPDDVVKALVPEWADLAQLFARRGNEIHLLAYHHIDPAFHPILDELARVHRPSVDHATDPVASIIRTRTPRMTTWVQRKDVERATSDTRVHAMFDAIGPRNIVLVPLARGNEAYGALMVAMSASSRHFVDGDLEFMVFVAEKVGPILRT